MEKTILCPVDFSESSDAAVDLAVLVAKRQGARLALLHVDPPLPSRTIASVMEARRSHDAWLEARLATARERLESASVQAISQISQNTPAEGILSAARELGTSMIVLATHGSGLRRLLLGSVAEKVARAAPCPVLLLRGEAGRNPFDRPLIAVDFSPLSEPTARAALELVGEGGRTELLHVIDEPSVAAMQISLGQRQEVLDMIDVLHSEAHASLERFAGTLPLDEQSPELTVKGGPIAGTILGHAADTRASLIAIGSHHPETMRQRLLGTVADRVIRHAEVPVLLCPPAGN